MNKSWTEHMVPQWCDDVISTPTSLQALAKLNSNLPLSVWANHFPPFGSMDTNTSRHTSVLTSRRECSDAWVGWLTHPKRSHLSARPAWGFPYIPWSCGQYLICLQTSYHCPTHPTRCHIPPDAVWYHMGTYSVYYGQASAAASNMVFSHAVRSHDAELYRER